MPLLLLYKTDTKKIRTLLPTPLLPSFSLISATIPRHRRTQILPPRRCQAPLTAPPSVMMEVLITTSRVIADTGVPEEFADFHLLRLERAHGEATVKNGAKEPAKQQSAKV